MVTTNGEPNSPLPSEPSDVAADAARLGSDFEIVCCIGRGGMGAIYKAIYHPTQSTVAVKLVRDFTDEIALKRLQKEAQALGALNHPNIVRIHRFEPLKNGGCALVMELLDGHDLARDIAKGPMDVKDCVEIFRQVCDALEHAHQNGIVHRDIKPTNILVGFDGRKKRTVKLVDFGIAARLNSLEQRLTRTGSLVGSPSYMSPEQCSGAATDLTSDVYSLGCVLYECLSGRRPYEGETALEIMYKHVNEEAQRPQSISPACFEVIRKAMSRESHERYQSAEQFFVAFEESAAVTSTAPRAVRVPLILRSLLVAAVIALSASAGYVVNEWSSSKMDSVIEPVQQYDRMSLDAAIKLMEHEYLAKGAYPPQALSSTIDARAELSPSPDIHRSIADAWEIGAQRLPSRESDYLRTARHSWGRAVDRHHKTGKCCGRDATRFADLELRYGYTSRAMEVLDAEIKLAETTASEEFYIKTQLDKLAAYFLKDRTGKFATYKRELAKKYGAAKLVRIAGLCKLYQDSLLEYVREIEPSFPNVSKQK